MSNKTIGVIVFIIVLAAVAYWAYTKNKLSFLGINKKVTTPGEESDCNSVQRNALAKEGEGCTEPINDNLFWAINGVKEKCWTEDDLGYAPGPTTTIKEQSTIPGRPETVWFYNQTRKSVNGGQPYKYCFVNAKTYPNQPTY